MKDFNHSELLPNEWLEVPLKKLSPKVNSGFLSGKHNKVNICVHNLLTMNIDYYGYIDLTEIKYVQTEHYNSLSKGNIIFNNTNSQDLIGKTSFIRKETNWAYSNHMTRIRFDTKLINSKYVAYFLHNLFLHGFFKLNCS